MSARIAVFGVVVAAVAASGCDEKLHEAYNADTCDASEPAWVARFSKAAAGPEQRWINYGATADEMVIGWLTAETTASSTVEYGRTSGSYDNTVTGSSTSYDYGTYTSPLIHHVTLTGLTPNTRYFYRVGDSDTGFSDEANFTSNRVGPFYPFIVGSFADIGESANAEATVEHLRDNDDINAFLLNGDLS